MNQLTVSLWGDEAWAATLAIKPIAQIIRLVAKDTSPPLYYLLLHTWLKIFGPSEIAIRSLSCLFLLLTVVTVYLIGRHLADKKTGFWAALLTLTNPFLFNYAFEGRMYALLLLTGTLSIYFFLKKQRWSFILATTAALYTHHFSIFIVFWEALWTIKENWSQPTKTKLKKLFDFLIIGALYLPWLYPLYYQTSLIGSGFWLGRPTLQTVVEVAGRFLIGPTKSCWATTALVAFILALLWRRWDKERKTTFFLLGWFWTPLLATYLISQFFQPIFFDRYMLMAIPAATLLLGSNQRKLTSLWLLIAVVSLTILNVNNFFHPIKRPFRQLAEFVKKEASDLPLVNYSAGAHHLFESKYYGLEAPIYTPQPLPYYTGTAIMEADDTTTTLPEAEKLGVITSAEPNQVSLPGFTVEKVQSFDRLHFLWLKRD